MKKEECCFEARTKIPNFILRKRAQELGMTKENFLELWNKDHNNIDIQIVGKDIAEHIFNPTKEQIESENNFIRQIPCDINWDEELNKVKDMVPFKYFIK